MNKINGGEKSRIVSGMIEFKCVGLNGDPFEKRVRGSLSDRWANKKKWRESSRLFAYRQDIYHGVERRISPFFILTVGERGFINSLACAKRIVRINSSFRYRSPDVR